jgi:hypothetical protein
MTAARLRALGLPILALVAAAAAAFALAGREHGRALDSSAAESRPAQRPALLLLTSLPLIFGEEFSIAGGGSPALKALETRYRVTPISVTDPSALAKGRLLLMAHPLAQRPEDLVSLDGWVRRGGRLLLLADPLLEWPSVRPLGDPLRPPPMFMDTGLLAHWGLRLDAPSERGPKLGKLGRWEVMTASPGMLVGNCEISKDRLVARCALGRGRATIVADADLLNLEDLDGPTQHNLDGVLDELARLEH